MTRTPMDRKFKECVKCGRQAWLKGKTCKRWDRLEGRMKYCGSLRIVPGGGTEADEQRVRNKWKTKTKKGAPRYPKWRRCNTCGFTSKKITTQHHPGGVYCGYMRVVRYADHSSEDPPGQDVK